MDAPVLIADVPEMEELLSACFPHRRIVYTSRLEEAVKALRTGTFSLIVIGLHFDHSQMFDLLRHIRQQRQHQGTSVIVVRGMPSVLSDTSRHGIEHAVRVLGGDAFIDFAPDVSLLSEVCQRLDAFARQAGEALHASDERSGHRAEEP